MSWQPLDVHTFDDAPLTPREAALGKLGNEVGTDQGRRFPRNAVSARRYCILLQELRLAGWKRTHLAELTSLTAPALRLIEFGQTKWVYPDTARCLDRLWTCLSDAVSA